MRVFYYISIFDKFKKIFMLNGKNFIVLNLFNFVLIYLKTLFQTFNYFVIKSSYFLNFRCFLKNKMSNKHLILFFNFCTNSFFYFNLVLESIRPVVLLSSRVFRGDIKKVPAFFNINDRSFSKTFRWFRDKMRTNTTVYYFFFERFFKEFFSLFVNTSNLTSLKLSIYADFEKGRSFLKFVGQKNSTINLQDLQQSFHFKRNKKKTSKFKKKYLNLEKKSKFKKLLNKKNLKKRWRSFWLSKENIFFFNFEYFILFQRIFFDFFYFFMTNSKYLIFLKYLFFRNFVIRFKKNIYNTIKNQTLLKNQIELFQKKTPYISLKKNKKYNIKSLIYFFTKLYRLKKYRRIQKKIKFFLLRSKIQKYFKKY